MLHDIAVDTASCNSNASSEEHNSSVLELLELDSNSNTNILDFCYYFIILIRIGFGLQFGLEWGTLFYYSMY